jgi:hypothetical protein
LDVNTPPSRVSASLCSVTARDQRRRGLVVVRRDAAGLLRRLVDLRVVLRAARPRRLDAAAFLAMIRRTRPMSLSLTNQHSAGRGVPVGRRLAPSAHGVK